MSALRAVRLDAGHRDGGVPWNAGQTGVTPTMVLPRLTPERRLMWAVLVQAVADLHFARSQPRRMRRGIVGDALEWFRAREDDWPFAFESICAGLDLDPPAVRSAVLGPTRTGWWGRVARRS